MKSTQLLRLQQQFLKSLHAGATPWLLDQIQPAHGFSSSEAVLSVYLERAMGRTVDPLRQSYRILRWLLGDATFDAALTRFYAASLGEPLSAQALATEFAAYFAELPDQEIAALLPTLNAELQAGCSPSQLIATAVLLDWRLLWCALAPSRETPDQDALLRILHHRCHLWSRPRLDRGSRLCTSLVDLVQLKQAMEENLHHCALSLCEQPSTFLVYANGQHDDDVMHVEGLRERILNHCDGTHTISSLIHEQSLYGDTREQTIQELEWLIRSGIIVDLQSALLNP